MQRFGNRRLEINGGFIPVINTDVYDEDADLYWAVHISRDYQGTVLLNRSYCIDVNMGPGGHGDGDWIVCQDDEGSPNPSLGYWVVEGRRFYSKYQEIGRDMIWKYRSHRGASGRFLPKLR